VRSADSSRTQRGSCSIPSQISRTRSGNTQSKKCRGGSELVREERKSTSSQISEKGLSLDEGKTSPTSWGPPRKGGLEKVGRRSERCIIPERSLNKQLGDRQKAHTNQTKGGNSLSEKGRRAMTRTLLREKAIAPAKDREKRRKSLSRYSLSFAGANVTPEIMSFTDIKRLFAKKTWRPHRQGKHYRTKQKK